MSVSLPDWIRKLSVALILGCLFASPAVTLASPVAPVGHVFVIVFENENAGKTFGTGTAAPYLAQTLTSQGAYIPNYYGIGHQSLDNYIAMISGQPENSFTAGDCLIYANFDKVPLVFQFGTAQIPAGEGCVYPSSIKTIASQLDASGKTWRGYMEDMGNDPTRESATCGHPRVGAEDNTQKATVIDQYATRHDPFMYFHSIIDAQSYCDTHVVNLNQLQSDLDAVSTTPHFAFITPNLCDDGHDSPCVTGAAGGLAQADAFLQKWVPLITSSPAYQQDGLLVILFDESENDDSACCNEKPGPNVLLPGGFGPGGGKTGAVLLSRYIKPGTVTTTTYNHYAFLRSMEDLFGLSHLGFAGQSGLQAFGADVFTNASGQ
jgi:phosphatidylinositol-3-phosphatase